MSWKLLDNILIYRKYYNKSELWHPLTNEILTDFIQIYLVTADTEQ